MNEDEFLLQCQFLTDVDLAPRSIYRGANNEEHADSSASIIDNNITKKQNDEYEQVLKEKKIKQETDKMHEFIEKLKTRISEERIEESKKIREENIKRAENSTIMKTFRLNFSFQVEK
jgi:hypothetical protein